MLIKAEHIQCSYFQNINATTNTHTHKQCSVSNTSPSSNWSPPPHGSPALIALTGALNWVLRRLLSKFSRYSFFLQLVLHGFKLNKLNGSVGLSKSFDTGSVSSGSVLSRILSNALRQAKWDKKASHLNNIYKYKQDLITLKVFSVLIGHNETKTDVDVVLWEFIFLPKIVPGGCILKP